MSELLAYIAKHGDLAHMVLAAWAGSSTSMMIWALKQVIRFNRRFEDFMEALEQLNTVLRDEL